MLQSKLDATVGCEAHTHAASLHEPRVLQRQAAVPARPCGVFATEAITSATA